MDEKLRLINQFLDRYDPSLRAKRFLSGSLGLVQKRTYWSSHAWEKGILFYSHEGYEMAIPVTDNWLESGTPCDWGIEPILSQIQKLHWSRAESSYQEFCKERERKKEAHKQSKRNELRSIAYDCRKEFAKATNDINTSTLEKVDSRRILWRS